MSKRTKLLGTSCVLAAALAAGPAAADTLAGFNGFADANYAHQSYSCSGCDDWNMGTFGAGMALPLADLPNLNWQIDGSYSHQWTSDSSREVWNFGFSPFWAGPQSRFGLDLAYLTANGHGSDGGGYHVTNGGGFFEWYLGNATTVAAKGGYLSTGGTQHGGNGNYIAGAVTLYATPDFAASASIDWQHATSGFGCSFGPPCQTFGYGTTAFGIDAEFLPDEDLGLAIFGGYTYQDFSGLGNPGHASVFNIGVRYYTGTADGTLQNRHRNGNLHTFLRGP